MKITKSKIKNLILEKADRIFVERAQTEVQTQIEEALVDLHQLGNKTASDGIKRSSDRFPEPMGIAFFSGSGANDVMEKFFKQWCQLETCRNAVVKRIVPNLAFICAPTAFIIKIVE